MSDLGSWASKALKQLNDPVEGFYDWTVDTDGIRIRQFVIDKLGPNGYKAGNAFYELTKTENLPADREIIIIAPGGKFLSNKEARRVMNLDVNRDTKIRPQRYRGTPGNKIFIQSKSHTRKLVRGAKLLYKKAL